jgi:hypothetical protein
LKELIEDPNTSRYMRLRKITEQPNRNVRPVERIEDSQAYYNHVVCGMGIPDSAKVAPKSTEFGVENEGRNIVLSLNVDGFTPMKTAGRRSITAFQAQIINLPENLRVKKKYMMVAGLVPGPKAPQHIEPYLQVMVDHLLQLWHHGFSVLDPIAKKRIVVKVKLLFVCSDMLATADLLSHQPHTAYMGCYKCHIEVSPRVYSV